MGHGHDSRVSPDGSRGRAGGGNRCCSQTSRTPSAARRTSARARRSAERGLEGAADATAFASRSRILIVWRVECALELSLNKLSAVTRWHAWRRQGFGLRSLSSCTQASIYEGRAVIVNDLQAASYLLDRSSQHALFYNFKAH